MSNIYEWHFILSGHIGQWGVNMPTLLMDWVNTQSISTVGRYGQYSVRAIKMVVQKVRQNIGDGEALKRSQKLNFVNCQTWWLRYA